MSEDQLPKPNPGDPSGDPGDADDDPLRRAAQAIRASKSLQALVPLSASERERLADAAIEQALGAPAARIPAAGAPVLRPRFGRRSVTTVVATTLALAAAVTLYVRGGGRAGAPLAGYAMIVEGEQQARGAAEPSLGAPVTLHPETRLVVTLAAQHPERAERDARIRLVLVRQGHATVLDPPITSKAGRLSIEGPTAELLGMQRDGPAELVVVLGRELPGDDEIQALALRASGEAPHGLQVMRRAVILTGFSHAAIDVLLGGCSAVLDVPGAPEARRLRCEIAAGSQLHLWVGVPATAGVEIRLGGQAVAQGAEPRGGGSGFDLDVAARTGVLSVRMEDHELAAWDLAPAAVFAQIRAADKARAAGRLDEATAELDAIPVGAPAEEQLEAVRRRAKLARARGDAGQERAQREHAVALARSLGRVSAESDETIAILHGLMAEHALPQAAQLLRGLDAHGMIYAEGAVDRELVHGALASELGDLGAALGAFQRALATTERIGDAGGRATILGALADVLQSLGRDREAAALIDAEIERGERDSDVCARVDALTTAGWLLRDVELPRAQRLVDQAAALAGARCPRLVPITLVNQGWLLAAAGRFGDARAVLSRLAGQTHERDGRVTTWALRLEAEIVLGEAPARAEQHAQRLAARAAALCSTELAYEAHLLHARALAALDRPDQAAAAFAEAAHALALWSRLVPLGEGRDTFFQRHDQLALTAIPFFLAQARRGAPGAGLALAITVRQSLALFVTSLEAGGRARARAERGEAGSGDASKQFAQTLDRWPASPGAQDPPGEAVAGVCETRDAAARLGEPPALSEPPAQASLFVHPAPQGWLVLVWRGSSIDFRELPRAGSHERPDELSARITSAAAPLLAGAPRVHLHVHRSLAALPLDRSLAARLAVPTAFAVDARPRVPGASCAGATRALLVTNPQQNLWAASASARVIEGDLARIGFAVDTLEGAAATRAAIDARLADPCTALFQYDGHGSAGAAGLAGDRSDDALLLAGGDTLTAADVLGLPRAPEAVVLNGCTTAAPEGLGLAQAFLLAGAAQVVASLDVIPADAAATFTRTLFAGAPPRAGRVDLVRLFARAVSGADLPGLRVFER
jgi:tetratricopeptide (TPR) repeat protein